MMPESAAPDLPTPDSSAPESPVPGSPAPRADALRGLPLQVLLAALNHLLAQQQWARDRLAQHAGRVVRLGLDPDSSLARLAPPMLLAITPQGRLQPASEAPPAVTLWLDPSVNALFEALQGGARGLRRHLRIDGDVMLAGTLGELAEHLRWDAEEDVSRLVGDVAAHRLAQFFRQASMRLQATRARVESSAVQYLTAEDPQLVAKGALSDAAQSISDLQARVDRLETRLAGLGSR